jgi:hypothetical protein
MSMSRYFDAQRSSFTAARADNFSLFSNSITSSFARSCDISYWSSPPRSISKAAIIRFFALISLSILPFYASDYSIENDLLTALFAVLTPARFRFSLYCFSGVLDIDINGVLDPSPN